MRLKLDRSGPWIGVGGILMETFVAFTVFFSVVKVPPWGVVLVVVLLLAQVIAVVRLARSRPRWCIYVPAIGLLAWFVLIFAGARAGLVHV